MIGKTRFVLYKMITSYYPWIYRTFYKMDIGKDVRISGKSILDKTINPKGIHIGKETMLTKGCIVLSHDYCRSLIMDTYIGSRCFIGMNAIIMPGVKIGNEVIVGSGAVVTKDVPSNCIVAGNPAKVIREHIKCEKWGVLSKEKDENNGNKVL